LFLAHEIAKAARIGFPMGGSLGMTSTLSWRGAFADHDRDRMRGNGIDAINGRARGGDRDGRDSTLRVSLPNVRHDRSLTSVCVRQSSPMPRAGVNLIFEKAQFFP
jgi:hypothetical protein